MAARFVVGLLVVAAGFGCRSGETGSPPVTPSPPTPPPIATAATPHCRNLPVPQLDTIRAIGGRSSSDLWIAGDRGLLAHCDGASWKLRRIGTSALRGIAVRPAGGVFVVGDQGTALAASRETTAPIAVATTAGLLSIWTAPDGYGWAVGGVVGPTKSYEREGVSWSHPANLHHYSIDKPAIVRVQNDRWVDVPQEGRAVLRSVWGASPTDVWAGGDNGTLLHWDGRDWKKQTSPAQHTIQSIAGSGTFGVFLTSVYYHRHGSSWSHQRSEKTAGWAAWAASSSSAWTVAMTGEVTRWDGKAWTTQRPATGLMQGGAAIHGFSDDDLWIASGTRLEHWNGASWK